MRFEPTALSRRVVKQAVQLGREYKTKRVVTRDDSAKYKYYSILPLRFRTLTKQILCLKQIESIFFISKLVFTPKQQFV